MSGCGRPGHIALLLVPITLFGVVVAFTAGMAVLDSRGHPSAAWTDAGVARAVLGTAAYLVGIGLIGVALGVLIRATAGAIGVLLAGVLILPTLATALLPSGWDDALKFLPSNAGSAFTTRAPDADLLSSAAGMAVFAAWTALALAAAAIAFGTRDV